MLPSACVQVLPAFRNAKISPGLESKMVSKGTCESAHPIMAQCGASAISSSFLMVSLVVFLNVFPDVNRVFPSFKSLIEARASAPVRTGETSSTVTLGSRSAGSASLIDIRFWESGIGLRNAQQQSMAEILFRIYHIYPAGDAMRQHSQIRSNFIMEL